MPKLLEESWLCSTIRFLRDWSCSLHPPKKFDRISFTNLASKDCTIWPFYTYSLSLCTVLKGKSAVYFGLYFSLSLGSTSVSLHSLCCSAAHPTQLFQSSILIMDIATYRLNQPRGQSSENHLKCITRWEVRDLFPAYKGWTQDQLCIRRHAHKDFKWTKLCSGPIQTCLGHFWSSWPKQKLKRTQNWLL